jgi:peptidoglycan/LPS O-acetylase OafA/YrhL
VIVHPIINLVIVLMLDRCITRPDSVFGRFLNFRPVAFVGVISYSLYLWQQAFLDRFHQFWFTAFPQNLVGAFAAALASYYLVESPFLRLRKRLEDRRAGSESLALSHCASAANPAIAGGPQQRYLRSTPPLHPALSPQLPSTARAADASATRAAMVQ